MTDTKSPLRVGVGGPVGSGKTALLDALCKRMRGAYQIAVVTNEKRKFLNHIQYGEVAAEMKEHAKTVAGSTLMVDQRGDDSRRGKKDRKLISLQDAKRGTKG